MKRIVPALLVPCLVVGIGSLFSQQATVKQEVSPRGDSSAKVTDNSKQEKPFGQSEKGFGMVKRFYYS